MAKRNWDCTYDNIEHGAVKVFSALPPTKEQIIDAIENGEGSINTNEVVNMAVEGHILHDDKPTFHTDMMPKSRVMCILYNAIICMREDGWEDERIMQELGMKTDEFDEVMKDAT